MPSRSRALPLAVAAVQMAMLAWLVLVWANQEAAREGTLASTIQFAVPAAVFGAAAAVGFLGLLGNGARALPLGVRIGCWTAEGLTFWVAAGLALMVLIDSVVGGIG